MNRLAVGRSARAQQAHKVDNRIDRLMALSGKSVVTKFYSGQDRHTDTNHQTTGNPRFAESWPLPALADKYKDSGVPSKVHYRISLSMKCHTFIIFAALVPQHRGVQLTPRAEMPYFP